MTFRTRRSGAGPSSSANPHFDVSLGYRERAIKAGAIPVDRRGIVGVMNIQRERLAAYPAESEAYAAGTARSTNGKIVSIRARARAWAITENIK